MFFCVLSGQISFFSSASRFSASSGVNRFKSISRNLSNTGCERGVKIVNWAGAGVAPEARAEELDVLAWGRLAAWKPNGPSPS